MKHSLYAQYVIEREGLEILETEHGFAVYEFANEKTVYLRDIFVVKEQRKGEVARNMALQIAGIAKARGMDRIVGSVCIKAKGVTTSLKVLLADGFSFSHQVGDMLFFDKAI